MFCLHSQLITSEAEMRIGLKNEEGLVISSCFDADKLFEAALDTLLINTLCDMILRAFMY